jgi:hypothetical protein
VTVDIDSRRTRLVYAWRRQNAFMTDRPLLRLVNNECEDPRHVWEVDADLLVAELFRNRPMPDWWEKVAAWTLDDDPNHSTAILLEAMFDLLCAVADGIPEPILNHDLQVWTADLMAERRMIRPPA